MRRGVVLGLVLAVVLRAAVRRVSAWWFYRPWDPGEMKGRSYW